MADELEIRVIVTRKASSDAAGEDVQLAEVTTSMNSAERERFNAFLIRSFGLAPDGTQRNQQQMVEAFWLQNVVTRVTGEIEYHEKALRDAAADALAAPFVTTTV